MMEPDVVPMHIHHTLIGKHSTVMQERDELRDEIMRLKSLLTARGFRISAKSDVASDLARISQQSGASGSMTRSVSRIDIPAANDLIQPPNDGQVMERNWHSWDWLALPLDPLLQDFTSMPWHSPGMDVLNVLLSYDSMCI